jgi:hypothetical protein
MGLFLVLRAAPLIKKRNVKSSYPTLQFYYAAKYQEWWSGGSLPQEGDDFTWRLGLWALSLTTSVAHGTPNHCY